MSVYSTKIDIFESVSSSISNKNDVENMNEVGRFASQFLAFPHDNEGKSIYFGTIEKGLYMNE